MSIEIRRKIYVENRVNDEIMRHMKIRLRKKFIKSFETVEKMLKLLKRIYENLNRKHTVMKTFRVLRMRNKNFNSF